MPAGPGARRSERLSAIFGELERRSLDALWNLGEAAVAQVRRALGPSLAYTTVMTTLDRLHRKGVLARRLVGRAYVYSPLQSREEAERAVAARLLDRALGERAADARPILSCIVDAVGERDRALLDELERLVRAKRRQTAKAGRR